MRYNTGDTIEYEHGATTKWTVVSVTPIPTWNGKHFGNLLVLAGNLRSVGSKTMSFFSYNDISTRKISVRRKESR